MSIIKRYGLMGSIVLGCIIYQLPAMHNAANEKSARDLVAAAQTGDVSMVEALLRGGEQESPTLLRAQFKDAIEQGDISRAADLIKRLKDPNDLGEDEDRSALMIAVEQGNFPLIKMLLAQPAIKIWYKNQDNKTALDIAIEKKNKEIIALLEQAYTRTEQLIQAVERGDLTSVEQAIISGLGVTVENADGVPLLTIAAKAGHVAIVRFLLGFADIDVNAYPEAIGNKWYGDDMDFKESNTALHEALARNHQAVAIALLEYPRTDITKVNGEGESVLFSAIKGIDDESFFNALLDRYDFKRLINTADYSDATPLRQALKDDRKMAARILLNRSATDTYHAPYQNVNPLMKAMGNHNPQAVALLLSRPESKVSHQDHVSYNVPCPPSADAQDDMTDLFQDPMSNDQHSGGWRLHDNIFSE